MVGSVDHRMIGSDVLVPVISEGKELVVPLLKRSSAMVTEYDPGRRGGSRSPRIELLKFGLRPAP